MSRYAHPSYAPASSPTEKTRSSKVRKEREAQLAPPSTVNHSSASINFQPRSTPAVTQKVSVIQRLKDASGKEIDISSLSPGQAEEHLANIDEMESTMSERRKLRSLAKGKRKREEPQEDEYAYLDDPEFGKNPNYQKEQTEYNKFNQRRRKKIKLSPKAEKLPYRLTTGELRKLPIVSPGFINDNFENLKGNDQADSYAVKTQLNDVDYYQRTSYSKDVGFSPLAPHETDDVFVGSKERTFQALAEDLDESIANAKVMEAKAKKAKLVSKAQRKRLRLSVGQGLQSVRDTPEKASFTPGFDLDPETRDNLEPTIAEMGNIFTLDLARAGKLAKNAKQHQDELLGGKHSFESLFGNGGSYLGIKAEDLRKKENYH